MFKSLKNKSKRIASSIAAGVLLFSQFAAVPVVSANGNHNNNDKVWICHANSAITNVYNKQEVNKSAVDGQGNGDHYLEHNDPVFSPSMVQGDEWGDIIPPVAPYHTGLNWTTEGQAIYNNNCTVDTLGSIKIVKDAQPNSTDDFDFTFDKTGSSYYDTAFELEDDGDNGDGQRNYNTEDDLPAGTYIATESPEQSGWVLNSIACSEGTAFVVDLASKKVTITLANNQDVTCTFTNVPAPTYGSVKINKKVDNGNGVYVSANGSGYPFRWGVDNEVTDNLMGSTQANVLAGTHAINENMVNGYEFTGWYVTSEEDNSGQHQVNCKYPQGATLPVSVTIEKSKTKELTFCNKVKRGSITIIKDAQPDSHQDFDFNINQKGEGLYDNFELEDDGNNNDSEKNYKTFDKLHADEYVVTEFGEEGWKLTDITCSEGATAVIDKANGKVTITLGYGENVTCTFVNQKKGKITVHKHTDPAGDQTEFDIEATTDNGAIFSDTTRKIADGETEYFWVGFGSYDVNETLPADWAQTDNTCVDVVINAENLYAECHIYNTKKAELTIIKHAYPQDGQDFQFVSQTLGDFTIDVDGDSTHEAFKRFTGLNAGTYTIAEEAVANWDLTELYCDTSDKNYEVLNGTLSITLRAGDDIACYFVNVKQNAINGHVFNDVNGNHEWDESEPALSGWTVTLTKECEVEEQAAQLLNIQSEDSEECSPTETSAVTNATGAYSFNGLASGTYTVCEVLKANWAQTYPQNNNGCHTIVIKCGDHGVVFTANFGNKAKPQILGGSTTFTPRELAKTGASTAVSLIAGLTILSALAAVHFLTVRRKDYAQ